MKVLLISFSWYTATFLLVAFVMVLLAACTAEQQSESIKPGESVNLGKLGTVNFSTSAKSEKAQVHNAYGKFSQQWQRSDADLSERREALDYPRKIAAR
jgi:hypothetical protein